MMSLKENHIPAIDGLRGFAAIYIFLFHLGWYRNVELVPYPLLKIFNFGWVAVELFFVVSGFLVFKKLKEEQFQKNWKIIFYLRRAFRILPLWWLTLGIVSVSRSLPLEVVLTNAFFLFGFVSYDIRFLPITPAWSLFVEEWFYILLPLVALLLTKGRNIIYAFILALIVANLWWKSAAIGVTNENFFIYRLPISHFTDFLMGIGVLHLYDKFKDSNWVRQTTPFKWTYLLDVFTVICFFAPAFGVQIPYSIGATLLLICTLLRHSLIRRIFSISVLRWAGRRCYAIYLFHAQFIETIFSESFLRFLPSAGFFHTQLFLSLFAICSVMVCAEISWRLWERPWQKYGQRLAIKFNHL